MTMRGSWMRAQCLAMALMCYSLPALAAIPQTESPAAALMEAAERGGIKDVKAALFDGADVNAHDRYRRTPLMYAASEGHLEVVRILLTRHANARLKSFDRYTALIMAAA